MKFTNPMLIEDLGMLFPKPSSTRKRRYGLYLCNCSKIFIARTDQIISSHTKSCGCHKKIMAKITHEKHKLSTHRLYNTWQHMISRCTNTKHKQYKSYGGRGITVCDRWLDVSNFIKDMDDTYEYNLSIDRINNDSGYSPENCRWTTREIQTQNTRLIRSTNTSGYRGVRESYPGSNRWMSKIGINRKAISLGTFDYPWTAAYVYDSYAIKHKTNHTKNFCKKL